MSDGVHLWGQNSRKITCLVSCREGERVSAAFPRLHGIKKESVHFTRVEFIE